jgi:adenylylsulfate kinase
MAPASHLTRHKPLLDADQRAALLGQHGAVVWLTGLSGSGKSTIAYALEMALVSARRTAFVLDGDNVRTGLNSDLGFDPADRVENIRRLGEVAALFADAGVIAITAFISPYRADRDRARQVIGSERFVEAFVNTPLEVCEQRDPKGLYQRARAGELAEFTGISAPYEPPLSPDVVLDTTSATVDECAAALIGQLTEQGFLR